MDGMESKSVERTKKLPWNEDIRRPRRCISLVQNLTLLSKAQLTFGSTDTNDTLEAYWAGQDLSEFVGKFQRVLGSRRIESRIVVSLTRGIVGEVVEGRYISVRRAEQKHVDRNLSSRAIDSESFIEAIGIAQKSRFLPSRHQQMNDQLI